MTNSAEIAQFSFSGRAGVGSARVPDFFLAGHPKCGTTALYEMLRAHPQIFMPEVKEPRYFASDMRQRFQPRRSGRLPATLEEYLSTGACKEGAIGLPEAVRRLPNGSFDLGLTLFKLGESFGARFGAEDVDGHAPSARS